MYTPNLHDYFNGGSYIRSAVYGLPKIEHPLRYVPWCLGVYRKHIRYVPFCLGVFRHQTWFTVRNDSVDPVERKGSNLRFLWNNLWDSGDVTASSEQVRFPASYTQHRWLSRCWRSGLGDIEGVYLERDLGEPKDIRAFVLDNHWFNPGSTVRLQAKANAGDAYGAVNEVLEVTDDKTPLVKCWDNYKTYRFWRVLMNAEDVSGTLTGEEDISTRGDRDLVPYCKPHFKVGRIFLGDYFEVSQNFRRRSHAYTEESQEFRTDRKGYLSDRPAWRHRHFFYDFKNLGSSNYDSIWSIFEAKGKGIPFYIIEDYKYWWKKLFYVTWADELKYDYKNNRVTTTLHMRAAR